MKRLAFTWLWMLLILTLGACSNQRYAQKDNLSKLDDNILLALAESSFKKGDYKTAAEYLSRASDRENPRAQYALGYLYYYGKGVPQNKTLGNDLIRKAAIAGNPNAIKALNSIVNNNSHRLANFNSGPPKVTP